MVKQLYDAVTYIHSLPSVRVVFLRAQGRMFSAGGDPTSFQLAAEMSDEDNEAGALMFADFLRKWKQLPMLTVAMVQGSAMGGGVGLVSICDYAIAVQSAFFALSEVKLGVIPAVISPHVVEKIGTSAAKRYFCTGESFSSSEAKRLGLVMEVAETADAMTAIAKTICSKMSLAAPEAVRSAKELVEAVAYRSTDEWLMSVTSDRLACARKSGEAREGMAAIQQKKKPSWANQQCVLPDSTCPLENVPAAYFNAVEICRAASQSQHSSPARSPRGWGGAFSGASAPASPVTFGSPTAGRGGPSTPPQRPHLSSSYSSLPGSPAGPAAKSRLTSQHIHDKMFERVLKPNKPPPSPCNTPEPSEVPDDMELELEGELWGGGAGSMRTGGKASSPGEMPRGRSLPIQLLASDLLYGSIANVPPKSIMSHVNTLIQ